MFSIYYKNYYSQAQYHTKANLCILVCMVPKEVHLELVTDLTVKCFIATLLQLSFRRGTSTHLRVYSTVLQIGANSRLQLTIQSSHVTKDNKPQLTDFTAFRGIQFHLQPSLMHSVKVQSRTSSIIFVVSWDSQYLV